MPLLTESSSSISKEVNARLVAKGSTLPALRVKRVILIHLLFHFISGGATAHDGFSQIVDASIHANWLQETDVYGIGGSAHFVFARYALELVPSGAHYFADDDTTDSWSFGLDGRLNLPTLGAIRPFVGTGFVRLRQDDESEWLLNLSGGFYARIRGDRIIPFIEGAYRPADSLNPWRFRSGLRFIMRER